MHHTRRTALAAIAATLALAPLPSLAQNQPIRLIVGASPGGVTDLVARSLAKGMADELGRTVVVENKAGAAGNIAAEHVARSAPDGNTLLVSYTSFSANPSLYKNLTYDPVKDFAPISLLATVPSVLAVRKDFPANNMEELMATLKANPGKYTAGLGGLGSSLHMATEVFKARAGVDIRTVPYKGAAPAQVDLLGNHIDMMFNAAANVLSVPKGAIKVLGVTSLEPLKEFPGVPPIADRIPDFEFSSWYGVFGPAKLAADDVERLNKAVRAAVASKPFQELMATQAAHAQSSTPQELADFLVKEIKKYAEVVELTGMSVD
jgi:Uncharacterized protein conserved in bacteria